MCVFVTGYTRLETKFPLRFFISESRNSGYGEDFRLFQPRSFFFKNDGVSGGKFLQASALCLDANELNAFIFRCMNGAMSVGTNHKPVTCFDINDLAINIELALAAQNTVDFFVLLMSMDERYCGLSRKFINRNFAAGQAS